MVEYHCVYIDSYKKRNFTIFKNLSVKILQEVEKSKGYVARKLVAKNLNMLLVFIRPQLGVSLSLSQTVVANYMKTNLFLKYNVENSSLILINSFKTKQVHL